MFCKETNFKETSIGKIPKDWEVVRVKDVGKVVSGFGFPVKYQGKKDEEYLFVKVSDTNLPGNEKFVSTAENTINKDIARKLQVKICPPGTIIFPKIGMVIYLRKVRILAKAGTFDNNIMGIIPDKSIIDREFLYYYFLKRIDLTKLAGRTTAPSIKKSEVEKLKISLPPLLEQQRIAEILSTIDEAIQKTNEVIAKAERLKKGLMQELLTKGIGHKEFKDTEIGRIPKEWEITEIGKLFNMYKGTTPSTRVKEFWGGDIPFVTPTDITEVDGLNRMYLETTENYLTREGLESKGLKLVPENSLLFTSRATIGYLAINKVKVAINQGIISLISRNIKIEPIFYYYLLQKLRGLFERLAGGSTYKEISISTFSKIKIPLPLFSEQQKIAEILSTVDKKLEIERKEKARLERIKQGMMDLLLTGKVRVKVN